MPKHHKEQKTMIFNIVSHGSLDVQNLKIKRILGASVGTSVLHWRYLV